MPSPKSLFSFPPSSSSSPSDSPLKENGNESNFFKSSGKSWGMKGRLTRQRKLRHASDAELGLGQSSERSQSLPVSPTSGSRSPRHVSHWSTFAVPQPLPLPELGPIVKQRQHDRRSSCSNMPSQPRDGRSRLDGDGRRDGTAEGSTSGRVTSRTISHQATRKTADHVYERSPKSPIYFHFGCRQDIGIESLNRDFRLKMPAKSAPSSGFSSPSLSPRRYKTDDLFHGPPALDVSIFDGAPSHDHSPLHSPKLQSPCRNIRNAKSLPESAMSWLEGNNANVHPLPLPPAVSRTPQSSSMDKADVPSIKGQWQKRKLIGRGTYGSVYLATNLETGALCAMKEVDLIPDDSKSAECIKQLEQEIKVLSNLKHANIVQYYGCELIEDRFCIYLEYVHPGSLSNYVRDHCGAMTESVVRNFTRHVLTGLAYLHSARMIHRDIKGANLLVNASGVVKLADFGLAKHLTGHATFLSLKGSPHWLAPEVLHSVMRQDANPDLAFAIDIWSLGCTVIEMLTGKPPWSEFSSVQAMFNVLNKAPPIPETLSLQGKDFLRRCFQRNPADRPSAVVLLDHPFLHSLHDQNGPIAPPVFRDAPQSPRNWNMKDLLPLLPGKWLRHGKQPRNSETSDNGRTSRRSLGSPEVVQHHASSSPWPNNCSSRTMNNPSNGFNTFHFGHGNSNQTHPFSRNQGKEIPHL